MARSVLSAERAVCWEVGVFDMYGDEKRRTLLPHRKLRNNQPKPNKPAAKRPVVANIVTAEPIASEKIVLPAATKPTAASKVVLPVTEEKAAPVSQHYDALEPLIGDNRWQEPAQPQVRGQRRIPDFGLHQDVASVRAVRDDSMNDTGIVRASDWWPMRGGLSSEDGPGAWWNEAMRLTGTDKCHVMSVRWYMACRAREIGQANKHSFGGCYILHNMQDDTVYVGQSVDVPSRVYQHFSDSGCHGVYDDFCDKQADFEICMIDKDDTKYARDADLNRFERELIAAYDAYRSGYNLTRGNCPDYSKRDWRGRYAYA